LTAGEPSTVIHGTNVRHECFFFSSGDERLYGSLYSPVTRRIRLGMVVCQTWGMDGMLLYEWCHRLARDLAAAGVATIIPHWPGTLDSEGDPHGLTLDRLLEVGVDSATAAAQRCEVPAWGVLGIGFGAAVAAMVAPPVAASRLVLVQPALNPAAYFDSSERRSRRASLGAAPSAGWAFGHPIPVGLRVPEATGRIEAALHSFTGKGAVVRYRTPEGGPVPAGFDTVTARGGWNRPRHDARSQLRRTVTRWITRSLRSAG
jgi:hypothetical protein